jgi:hypothetical protein
VQAPFVYHDGRLSVAYQVTGYYTEQEEPEVPRLSPIQLEALRTVQAMAIDPELSIHFLLQPGDIELLYNTTVLHGREGFVDGEVRHPLTSFVDALQMIGRWFGTTAHGVLQILLISSFLMTSHAGNLSPPVTRGVFLWFHVLKTRSSAQALNDPGSEGALSFSLVLPALKSSMSVARSR